MEYRLFARHFTNVMNFRIILIIVPGTHLQWIQELKPFLPFLYKQTCRLPRAFSTYLYVIGYVVLLLFVYIFATTIKLPEKQAHFLKPLSSTLTQGMAYKRLNEYIYMRVSKTVKHCTVLISCPYPTIIT